MNNTVKSYWKSYDWWQQNITIETSENNPPEWQFAPDNPGPLYHGMARRNTGGGWESWLSRKLAKDVDTDYDTLEPIHTRLSMFSLTNGNTVHSNLPKWKMIQDAQYMQGRERFEDSISLTDSTIFEDHRKKKIGFFDSTWFCEG